MRTQTIIAALALAGLSTGVSAGWSEIDLDSYEHGRVLTGADLGPATVDADNFHSRYDVLVTFDTSERNTRDRDLEGPNAFGGGWSSGNLRTSNDILGSILIIQEMDRSFAGYTDASRSVVRRPDDEGRRRGGSQPGAGEITLDFHKPITAFDFTLIDIEETGEFNDETGFFATFANDSREVKVSFADFVDSSSPFYDPTIAFGNNSANNIQAITADQLGMTSFDRVTLNLGGSGGVGQMRVSGVPTPGAALAGLTMMGVILVGRGRRARANKPAAA